MRSSFSFLPALTRASCIILIILHLMSTASAIPPRRIICGMKILSVLALLAVLAYLPSQKLPLISDDYGQIGLSREYGPVSGWGALAGDALYRCRATSLILTHLTELLFGLSPAAFHASSLGLHILNVWLILALGSWPVIGWRNAAVAAGFFAVFEGPQEAVIWYAAVHEPLLLFFALLCCHAWLAWNRFGRWRFYGAALILFILALLSKESAVALIPLLFLFALVDGRPWKAALVHLLPFAVLAVIYTLLVFAASSTHIHLNDAGTFSLHAPFWANWARSVLRLLWPWGLALLLVLAIFRGAGQARLLTVGAAWIGIGLLPYSFLTYMPRVPSRHTYLASAGLALIAAAGFWAIWERVGNRRWVAWALAAVFVAHQCAYLWFKKQGNYLERAAPTEELVAQAAKADGAIYVHCFPYDFEIAERAVRLRLNKTVYPLISGRALSEIEDRAHVYCANPQEHWLRSATPSRDAPSTPPATPEQVTAR